MPCNPNPTCPFGSVFNASKAGPNFDTKMYGSGTPHEPLAHMGWVGFVVLNFDSTTSIGVSNTTLRVTGADLNLKQEITTPDVIDGRIDKTVYQLGPKLVDGTLNMPLIADLSSGDAGLGCQAGTTGARTLVNNVWAWSTHRDIFGRMCNIADVDIRYANHAAFNFDNCIVNTLTMNVAQSDLVSWDINVIGRSRTTEDRLENILSNPGVARFMSPARVLTWNDVTINGLKGCQGNNISPLFYSNMIRNFTMEINNNVDRFFTLNGTLFPLDINCGKREVTGSLTLLGMIHDLRLLAQTNQERFTEQNEIRVCYYVGKDTAGPAGTPRDWIGDLPVGDPIFSKRLASVVFNIEEVSMTNEVLETTVNYLALASDKNDALGDANYEFVVPATSCGYPHWGTV